MYIDDLNRKDQSSWDKGGGQGYREIGSKWNIRGKMMSSVFVF